MNKLLQRENYLKRKGKEMREKRKEKQNGNTWMERCMNRIPNQRKIL